MNYYVQNVGGLRSKWYMLKWIINTPGPSQEGGGAGGALAPPVFGRYKCSKWRPIHRYQVPAFQQSWMDRFRAEFRFFQSMSICQEWFKILNIPYVFIFIGQSICEMKHLPNQNSKGPNVTFFHQDLSIVKNFVGCPSKWNHIVAFAFKSWVNRILCRAKSR